MNGSENQYTTEGDDVRRLCGLAAVLLGSATLAACGSGQAASDSARSRPATQAHTTTARTTTTAKTLPSGDLRPEQSYRWELATDDGLRAAVDIQIGEVVPASRPTMALPGAFRWLKGNCALDGERDGLLPLIVTIRNLTDGFSISPWLDLQWLGTYELPLDVAVTYSSASGPQCQSWDESLGIHASDMVPDGSESVDWLVVLHDFYSPAAPDGDVPKFAQPDVRMELFDGDIAEGKRYALTCASRTATGRMFHLVDDGARRTGSPLGDAAPC